MSEEYIHFLWKFLAFDQSNLQTVKGEKLSIFKIGEHNHDAGPDFLNAKVKIDNLIWVGNIEIHKQSSEWYSHKHHLNPGYNVILHVVWKYDRPVYTSAGDELPTLEIGGRAERFLKKFNSFHALDREIPCAPYMSKIDRIYKVGMIERCVIDRMDMKAQLFNELLLNNNNDWRQTFFEIVSIAMGGHLNKDPMLRLAKTVTIKNLLKHRNSLMQLEALLFGAAGMLKHVINDNYMQELKREFELLAFKYGLDNSSIELYEWKYARVRPANFPTIKIAQLAALVYKNGDMLSLMPQDLNLILNNLLCETSEYWHRHYRFGSHVNSAVKRMGKASVNTLLINSFAPFLYFKYLKTDEARYLDLLYKLLNLLPFESNRDTRELESLQFENKSAWDSQGLKQLKTHFCDENKCLHCNIGVHILRGK